MSTSTAISYEQRPRDFSARYRRSRMPSLRSARRRRHRGRGAVLLLGAVTLPAFAAPGDWERFQIGDAEVAEVQLEPMPFEQSGSSFPGSAFYYLELDTEPPRLGEGIRSDADIARPGEALEGPAASQPVARALRIDNSGIDRTRALQCLSAAIYYEARSEAETGQRAVAQVVLNRVAHPAYPNTVCGVVYQGSERRTGCQFSFTCDGSLAKRPNPMFWHRAEDVARAAMAGYVHAPAGLATHYHTVQIYPYWAPKLNYLGTIGAHRFYSFNGKAGQQASFRFAYAGGEPAARRHKPIAGDTAQVAALDPVAVQAAYDAGRQRAAAAGLMGAESADASQPSAAPRYSQTVRDRGGDSLYQAEKLPGSSGIRPEYRNSGRWIAQPGS